MSQTKSICTFCGAALTPGKGVCDFCGAPVEDSLRSPLPQASPLQPDTETLIDDSPPITSVEPPPEPFLAPPASYPEASAFPAAQEPANSTRSRPVWVWVLVAVLVVVLVCVCIGVIGSIFLF